MPNHSLWNEANAGNVFEWAPSESHENGVARYLWAQQTLKGDKSALSGRPNIIVTTTRELPHAGNAARIIEAKCVQQLGDQTIRAEFGKAYDLRVATYLISTFYSPSPKAIEGARV